jgi:hypothetical protein
MSFEGEHQKIEHDGKLSIKLSIYKSGANHKEMEYVLFT